eukprot:gene28222-35042_t
MSFALSTAIVNLDYLALASSGTGQYMAASGAPVGNFITSSNVYLSSDYGASWNVSTDLPDGLYGAVTSSTSGETLSVCSQNVGVYISANFGSSWSLSAGTSTVAQSCGTTLYTPTLASSDSGQYIYSLTLVNGLYYSSNYGATWTAATGAPTSNLYQGIASSPSGQYVASTTSLNAVYLSQNFGVTYAKTLAPNTLWNSFFVNDAGAITLSAPFMFSMYKSTDLGDVMQSSNSGGHWTTPSSLSASTLSPQSTSSNSDGSAQSFGTNGNGIYTGSSTSSTDSGGSSSSLSGGAVAGIVIAL